MILTEIPFHLIWKRSEEFKTLFLDSLDSEAEAEDSRKRKRDVESDEEEESATSVVNQQRPRRRQALKTLDYSCQCGRGDVKNTTVGLCDLCIDEGRDQYDEPDPLFDERGNQESYLAYVPSDEEKLESDEDVEHEEEDEDKGEEEYVDTSFIMKNLVDRTAPFPNEQVLNQEMHMYGGNTIRDLDFETTGRLFISNLRLQNYIAQTTDPNEKVIADLWAKKVEAFIENHQDMWNTVKNGFETNDYNANYYVQDKYWQDLEEPRDQINKF